MTSNTNLTNTSFQSSLVRLPTEVHNSTVCYLEPKAARALFSTCRYFHEFSQNDEVQRSLLALHFPLFRPLHDNRGESVFTSRSYYERLSAANSRKPGVVCCGTLNVGNRTPFHMQLTPDETKLLAVLNNPLAGGDGLINLYELNTGRCLWTLPENRSVSASKITPDGKKALLALDDHVDTVNLVDLETGQTLQTLVGHRRAINCIQISPNGENAYTGSGDGTVKRWNLATGECMETFYEPEVDRERSQLQQISQDGTTAISALHNGNLLFWSLATGQILQTLNGHPRATYYYISMPVKISPDKTTAVSCGDHEVRVWDLNKGMCKQVFSKAALFPTNLKKHIVQMEITPDMKRAILRCEHWRDGELIVLDLEKGQHQRPFAAHIKATSLQISPDGTEVVSGADGEIKIWNFCTLPEERLTQLARNCLSNPADAVEGFASLPQFAQDEVRAIQAKIINLEKSLTIYNAMKVALPTIKGFLAQAAREPDLAPMLVSEAIARINKLSPSIGEAVHRHFRKIQLEKGRSLENVFNTPEEFAALFINGSLIQDGIDAISRTIEEFKAAAN